MTLTPNSYTVSTVKEKNPKKKVKQMPSLTKLSTNNTKLKTVNGIHVLTLHTTQILKHNPATGELTLDAGTYRGKRGERSTTSRNRMNQYFFTRGLPLRVFQKGGEWFVRATGIDLPFHDGMTVTV